MFLNPSNKSHHFVSFTMVFLANLIVFLCVCGFKQAFLSLILKIFPRNAQNFKISQIFSFSF